VSFILMKRVLTSRITPSSQRLLACLLAFYSEDEDGQDIHNSEVKLAGDMNLSVRAVRAAFSGLRASGVLEHIGYVGHVKRHRFNLDASLMQPGSNGPETGSRLPVSDGTKGGSALPGSDGKRRATTRKFRVPNPEVSRTEPGSFAYPRRKPASAHLIDLDQTDLKSPASPECSHPENQDQDHEDHEDQDGWEDTGSYSGDLPEPEPVVNPADQTAHEAPEVHPQPDNSRAVSPAPAEGAPMPYGHDAQRDELEKRRAEREETERREHREDWKRNSAPPFDMEQFKAEVARKAADARQKKAKGGQG
jgi:hypothetical protein